MAAALTCALLASGAAAGAVQATSPSRPHAGAHPRARPAGVISPRPQAVLPARPLPIRLRVRRTARRLRATLNGHSILPYLSRRHRGVRRLIVSPDYGLRYGPNVLRVSARRGRKGRRSRIVVRFRIRDNRPLAAAGFDLVAAGGDRLRLDGSDSRPERGLRGRLRYRWSILGRPQRHHKGRRATASKARARLLHRNSPEPTLVPRTSGRFTLRLTVRAPDGKLGSDQVNVEVDPPPSVRLNTAAEREGKPGVALSGPTSAFYPGDASKWLQLVVLRRANLKFVSNTSYDCPQASQYPTQDAASLKQLAPCIKRLNDDLAKLEKAPGHPYLAIAVNQPGGKSEVQPPVWVRRAVHVGSGWGWWQSKPVRRGTFAAVFVPGLPKLGIAHAAADPSSPGGGMIDDNLARDNEGNYSVVPGERLRYDTRAPGSNADQNVIEVGDKRYVQKIAPAGGFQVVVVDARTLEGKSYGFGSFGARTMEEVLRKAGTGENPPEKARRLVFIATVGSPSEVGQGLRSSFVREFADGVEATGGTRGRFLDSMKGSGESYALVGEPDMAHGLGEEALGAGHTVRLRGMIARRRPTYQYGVQGTSSGGSEGGPPLDDGAGQLLTVAGEAPSAWPEGGDAAKSAAIRYIGLKALGTDDPRAQYWTLPYSVQKWRQVKKTIESLSIEPWKPIGPSLNGRSSGSANPDFSRKDFLWAKAELLREIDWLGSTYAYVEALAQPFAKTELESWAELQRVTAEVRQEVGAPVDRYLKDQTKMIFNLIKDLLESIPEFGDAVHAVDAFYSFGLDWSTLGGEPSDGEFTVKVAELGEKLAERLSAAQTLLTRQLPDRIVSDYRRLKTAGSCASSAAKDWSECPFDHRAWQFSQDDQAKAAGVLLRGSEASAYSKVLPLRYNAWVLPVSKDTNVGRYIGKGFAGFGCFYPFSGLPETARVVRPQELGGYSQIWALGYRTGRGVVGNPWEMHIPPKRLTDHLFGHGKGDLGVYPEAFFDRAFTNSAEAPSLNAFPLFDSATGWGLSGC